MGILNSEKLTFFDFVENLTYSSVVTVSKWYKYKGIVINHEEFVLLNMYLWLAFFIKLMNDF